MKETVRTRRNWISTVLFSKEPSLMRLGYVRRIVQDQDVKKTN